MNRWWLAVLVIGASVLGYYHDGIDRFDFASGFIWALAITWLAGYTLPKEHK